MNLSALWQARTGRERFLILLGLVVIVVAVYLVLSPTQTGSGPMLSAAVAKQRYQAELKKKQEADRKIAELQPKLDTITYKETSEKVIPVVLKTLHEHARKAGIRLREVKPLRPRQVGGVTKVSLTVRFSGVFGQVIPFVYYLEDPQGKLTVEKLNVSAPDPKSTQVDVEVQVAFFTIEPTGSQGDTKS